MEIGQKIETTTDDLFFPYIRAVNEEGYSYELPAKYSGEIVKLNNKNKEGHSVGVSFNFHPNQKMVLYLKPKNIQTKTQ